MRQKPEEEAVEYDKRNTRKTDVTSWTEGGLKPFSTFRSICLKMHLAAESSCRRHDLPLGTRRIPAHVNNCYSFQVYFTVMACIYSLQGKFFHASRMMGRNIQTHTHTHTHSTFNVRGTMHRYTCILYNQRDATYTMFFIIISALHVSGGFSAHHQELIKTVCAALGIVMFPAVYRWCGWVGTMATPKAAYTVL